MWPVCSQRPCRWGSLRSRCSLVSRSRWSSCCASTQSAAPSSLALIGAGLERVRLAHRAVAAVRVGALVFAGAGEWQFQRQPQRDSAGAHSPPRPGGAHRALPQASSRPMPPCFACRTCLACQGAPSLVTSMVARRVSPFCLARFIRGNLMGQHVLRCRRSRAVCLAHMLFRSTPQVSGFGTLQRAVGRTV